MPPFSSKRHTESSSLKGPSSSRAYRGQGRGHDGGDRGGGEDGEMVIRNRREDERGHMGEGGVKRNRREDDRVVEHVE